jgi:hypothetical protein
MDANQFADLMPPTPLGHRMFEGGKVVVALLSLLGQAYLAISVIWYQTTPGHNSKFSLVVSSLLLIIGPLSCLAMWKIDSNNQRPLLNKVHRVEIVSAAVGVIGSVALLMILMNIHLGATN